MDNDINSLSDYEVITLVLEEDRNYFEELVNRYKNLIFSVVSRMVSDREDIYDLSQEIFIKIYKNLDKYSTEFKFSTWSMRIATNHIIDFRRKKREQFGIEAYEDAGKDCEIGSYPGRHTASQPAI